MKKNAIIVFAIITTLFAYSCSNDEIDNQTTTDPNQEQEGPFTLNAKITVSEPFQTKASLVETVEGTTKTLRFEWAVDDKIQLAFVQEGKAPQIREATVRDVATDKRTGNFSMELPGVIDGNFTLYAYYGAGSIDEENPSNIILPDAGVLAGTLSEQVKALSMWDKQNIVFDGITPPELSINFKHIGAIMTLHVTNPSSNPLNDIANIELDGSSYWLYNESSRAVFDMSSGSGTFTETKGEGSTLSIKIGETIDGGETKTFYRWFVPGDFEQGLQLGLQGDTRESSINILPTNPFEAGFNYGLDITMNETTVEFEGVIPKIILTTSKPVGETIQIRIHTSAPNQPSVWIDLNNNGIREEGETPISFGTDQTTLHNYTIGSQTVTIYGNIVNRFDCTSSDLIDIDVSNSPNTHTIYLHDNLLTEVNITKNLNMEMLYLQRNRDLETFQMSQHSKLRFLNIESCGLSTVGEVESFYNQLPDRTGQTPAGQIHLRYNSGAASADDTKATDKNWTVTK